MNIPVLDATNLAQCPTDLVTAFAEAYGTYGFAYIANHGIPPALIDGIFDASRRFHALPLATKTAISVDRNHRGYIAINTSTDVNSTLADVTKPNQSASFMMMREEPTDPARFLSGPNQWPNLDNFRAPIEAYNSALTQLGQHLTKVARAACNHHDTSAFDRPTTWLRLLHYPPLPEHSPEDLYGSAPHTDFGALTILLQDNVGGLQVRAPGGAWLDAPPREGCFIVNVGDMLHRMSNGKLRSTPHRVINRSGRERYSCPFFFDPDVAADIAPLPETGTPRFEPINFGDFLRSELQASYDAHKDENP